MRGKRAAQYASGGPTGPPVFFLPLFFGCFFGGFRVHACVFRLRFAPKATASDFSTTRRKKVIPIRPQAIHRQSTGIPQALWIALSAEAVENPLS